MSGPALRVALLGGIPASLGGGGLELQRDRTAAALGARGHEVFRVETEPEPRAFDVLHAFGSEAGLWHALVHWRRNPAPLVVSSVVVVAPGMAERIVKATAKVPVATENRVRALALRRADVVIALTDAEAELVSALGAKRVEVIGNGVDPAPDVAAPEGLPERFVLLLGTVSARKRQREIVDALAAAGGWPLVVAGGWDGPPDGREAFAAAVARTGGTWLGEVAPGVARAVLGRAAALVHLSGAEGQSLAVLEALADGTRVIASPLPAQRELAARHPGWVELVDGPEEVPAALGRAAPAQDAPSIPTWDDVAAQVERVYRSVT